MFGAVARPLGRALLTRHNTPSVTVGLPPRSRFPYSMFGMLALMHSQLDRARL